VGVGQHNPLSDGANGFTVAHPAACALNRGHDLLICDLLLAGRLDDRRPRARFVETGNDRMLKRRSAQE
jgi:hypothetical protein